MANPLTRFFQDRFIQSAVEAGLEKALTDKQPVAYGIGNVPRMG
jgi:hypothetical protein